MCGIAGFIDIGKNLNADALSSTVSGMNDVLSHRGPDGAGIWVDQEAGIALAHRRLAIIDLSELGYQPMESHSGRYVITFNGEIYNFLSLKPKLEGKGHRFRGTSDTEVLLAAIEEWGLKHALTEINGMFAFALWDRQERVLHLARDRMGKKPIYYGWSGQTFLFGSELKALRKHPDFVPEIDRNVLSVYTRHNYVPTPWSIYKGIYKLPAASFISLSEGSSRDVQPELYWDLKAIAEEGVSSSYNPPFDDALNELDSILNTSVAERMISDVPLGSFLSGGIDSSLVTAIMQKNAQNPVKTFCIGFEESGYNEAPFAKDIAQHLGTDHVEYFVTAEEARNVIPDIPFMFDEPFADPSQIPMYHVSRLARQDVTVALSGDGGDEGFAGYDRYHRANKAVSILSKVPSIMHPILMKMLHFSPLSSKAEKIEILLKGDEEQFYRSMMSYWSAPEELVVSGEEPVVSAFHDVPDVGAFMNKMMYMDMTSYLTDDILVKVDRASMAASLETRAPLLDHKVIEYAWRVPISMKVDHNGGKLLLKSLLERYVPRSFYDRPKQGFGIPHGEWIKGPLKDWAEALLDEERLKQEGFFHPAAIRQKWEEHLSGGKDWSYALWGILMFQAWYEVNHSS